MSFYSRIFHLLNGDTDAKSGAVHGTRTTRYVWLSYLVVASLGLACSAFVWLALWVTHIQISHATLMLNMPGVLEGANIAMHDELTHTCADPAYFSSVAPKTTEGGSSPSLWKFCHEWLISKVYVVSPVMSFTFAANLLVLLGICLESIPRRRRGWSEERIAPLREVLEDLGLFMLIVGILAELALGLAAHLSWVDPFVIARYMPWIGSKSFLAMLAIAGVLPWIRAIQVITRASRRVLAAGPSDD